MFHKTQNKIIIIMAMLALMMMSGLYLLKKSDQNKITLMMSNQRKEKEALLDKIIELKSKSVGNFAYDYTYWDQMVDFVKSGSKAWAKENIELSMPTYGVDIAWVYRPDLSIMYSKNGIGADHLNQMPLSKDILGKIVSKGPLSHFFILTDPGLLEVFSASIHPTNDDERKTKPQGYFFVGCLWTETYLKEISTLSGTDLKLAPPGKEQSNAKEDDLEHFTITNTKVLYGWDGTHIINLQSRSEALIAKTLKEQSSVQYLAGIAYSIVLLLFLSFILFRLINRPLSLLSRSLTVGNTDFITGLASQKNEFGKLAVMISEFFNQKNRLVKEIAERKQVDETLRRDEEMLSEAQSLAHIGHWIWDLTTGKLNWSEEIFRIFGVDPQSFSVSAENFEKTIHPDDLSSFLQKRERMLAEESDAEIGHRIVRPDGEVRHVLERSKVMRDGSGNVMYVMGTVQDVTERMHAEESLSNSEERLDLAVQSARIGLWDQDFENDVIHRNSIWAEMLGYDPKEIETNKNAYLSLIHPDDFQRVKEKIEEHESGISDIFYVENRMKTKTNDWKWILNTGRIVQRSPDGKPLRAIGVHIDIHDQKQAIESLRKSEEMLSEAQSLAHIGHWIWDLTTGKLSWSDEAFRIFGFTPQSFSVSTEIFDKTIHPDDLASFLLARELMLVMESDVEIGHRIVRPDGEVRHVLERAKAMRNDSGKIVYVIGTILDVTERIMIEEMLKGSEIRFRELFNHINSGVAVYEARADGADFVFVDFNQAGEQIDNIRKEDVIGQSIVTVFPFVKKFGLFEIIQRVWKTGEPKQHPITLYKDKRLVGWRENFIYKLPSGEIVAVYNDITERKWVEDALHESEEKFSKTFHSNPHIITITTYKENKIIEVNDGFLQATGYTREEVINRSTIELGLWARLNDRVKILRRLKKHGKVRNLEINFHIKSGEIRTGLFSFDIINIGSMPHILTVIADITERRLAEEALLLSEERYRAVVEDQTEIISRFKADGTLTFINEVFCRLFGKPSHELIGKKWQPKTVAEDVPHVEAQLNTLSPTNPIVVIENRIYSGNRQVRWMQFVNRGFFDAQGLLAEIQSVGRDITDQRKAEEALHAASLYTRSLIEVSLDPLVTINAKGKVMDVNKAIEIVTGISRERLIGSDFSNYFTEPEKAKKGYRKVFKTGSIKDYPLAIRHQSGQVTDVLFNASVFRNEAGEILGVFAAARDITERKLTEEALRESEIKYRSLFENSMVGIFQISPEGRLLKINSAFAKMFGYRDPEEMIREISDIGAQLYVNPDQHEYIFRQLAERKVIEQREMEMVRRDGSRFWMLLTAREEREPNSMFLYYEGTAIDITERIWAIEELGNNQEKLRELTARLMHAQESEKKRISRELHDELGQTLTAVKINLVEMQKEIPSGARSDIGARLIETDAMIENMLDQIHQMALELRPALLDDLGLVPTLRWYSKHFKTRTGLDVHLDTGRPASRLQPDLETAVYRIVQEALTNITKHANATHVWIRIQRKRSVFTLSITDNGKGFDMEILENKRNRTGMGLISIRERVASLNGDIKIESSLGHGTTLLISLPCKGVIHG